MMYGKKFSSSGHLLVREGEDRAGYLKTKLNEEITKSNSIVRGSLKHVWNGDTGLNRCTLIVIHT